MESLNSEEEEIQIQIQNPGGTMPLLKPVLYNPFSASPQLKWFLISVTRTGHWIKRCFLNMSRHPRHVAKVLPTALRRNWHTFFLLAPLRDFRLLRLRYPMTPIGGTLRYPTEPRTGRKKSKFLQHQGRVKRLHAKQKNQKARLRQLLRSPQLVLASPKKSPAHLVQSVQPIV